jgi:flagellar secretion chaperone FliS
MFATAAQRNRSGIFTNAYRQVGIQTGVDGASAHQLVLMLFDGFQDSVAQARGAIAAGHIEAKGRAIGRAVRIVEEGLKAGLNMGAGGALAADLHALYAYVSMRLTEGNLRNDMAALEECARLLEPVRAAWAAIEPQTSSTAQ